MEALETIEKPAKKTYIKHKTEKKIGINFYLNQKLKPTTFLGKSLFPVYCRISYNGTDTKVKAESFIDGLSEEEWNNNSSHIQQQLEKERLKKEVCFRKILSIDSKPKSTSAYDLYTEYYNIYEKDLTIQLYQYLNYCVSLCYNICKIYESSKKDGIKDFKLTLDDEFISDTLREFHPSDFFSKNSPEINLSIASHQYPAIKQFLTSKYPSNIWRLRELMYFSHSINFNLKGFPNIKAYQYFTWYDYELGNYKEFLDSFIIPKILSADDIDKIMKDISKFNYLTFQGEFLESCFDFSELLLEFLNFME